ncbi:MAG: hypothetical protein KDC73_12230 [Ignavibacteriae bacterium]|nr:hypothetical protein [Ignavibacteriota bacterium]MCB0725455.1 hypothetical protein [Ignavibacteriota bacterium]MCB9243393.1 hypothetical protein [Ignavibacteriales bacterium]
MSLIKCPTCTAEISYNYDICPNCGATVYDFEPETGSEENYNNDFKDYVSTTKKAKWYHAAILFLAVLAMFLGVLWGFDDVLRTKALNSAPEESYILFAAGLGLFVVTKVVIHSDKRREDFF